MHFVEVLVAGVAYHGDDALTYSSMRPLPPGTIVVVPLRAAKTLGVVVRTVKKPSFKTKPVLEAPENTHPLPEKLLGLLFWMKEYYPSSLGVATQQFLPKQLPKKPLEPVQLTALPGLDALPLATKDQTLVLESVQSSGTHLLHGNTGTGKTRVYLELALRSVRQGKSAIILTPEIGLTSQLADDFRNIFGNRVVVVHSQLTEATRQRLWLSILQQNEPLIVIGARSALFSPLRRVGLIVVDEAHETAYKQDQSPYYHASRVASKLAELHKAPVILGSATPLVTDYYVAESKGRPILRMTQIATQSANNESHIKVVDLRDRTRFTRKSHLSDILIDEISATIQRKEQTLLFLNRRGTARIVFCEQCGWQAACPHCDLPLVYHGDSHSMQCHSCAFRTASPTSCPVCHNVSVVFKSIGTKAIVDEITKLFPSARIMRFDTDNKRSERIENHYNVVKSGEIDILVGTQTLAKGMDLPKLGLVGIIMADTSLYFPDFSAQERTYQLIGQVLGRIGRGHREGRAILQTYDPESPLLKSILEKDWASFYKSELAERRQFTFPPFCYLLKLTCSRASTATAEKAAKTFAQQLRSSGLRIIVEGPAPAFRERVQDKYQWQLIIKAKRRSELLEVIARLPSGWSYDIDPMNLL